MTEEELDKYRQTFENASEEYTQALEEFERQYGPEKREQYEERNIV